MHRRLDMAEAVVRWQTVGLIDVLFFRIFTFFRLIQNRRRGGWVIDLVGARDGAPTKEPRTQGPRTKEPEPRTENPTDRTSSPRIKQLDQLEALTGIGRG